MSKPLIITFSLSFFFLVPSTPGSHGAVSPASVQSRALDAATKQAYPVALLRLVKRHAEDLLWANDLTTATKVLTFLKLVTAGREEARDIYKGLQIKRVVEQVYLIMIIAF